MKINVIEQPSQAAPLISQWLQRYANKPVLVLASGGSAAPIFAEAWKNLSNKEQSNIILSLADERFNKPGHKDSNWELLRNAGIMPKKTKSIPVLQKNMSMEQVAQRWEGRLKEVLSTNIPVVALLGLGSDSHIAGIKPSSPAAAEQHHLIRAYEWDDFDRITITPLFLNKITSTVVYASGAAKLEPIKLLAKDLDPVLCPSQHLKTMQECIILYAPTA